MELVRELIINLRKNKSHVGYGFQEESEALVGHVLDNFLNSPFPDLEPERKNEKDSLRFKEEGRHSKYPFSLSLIRNQGNDYHSKNYFYAMCFQYFYLC